MFALLLFLPAFLPLLPRPLASVLSVLLSLSPGVSLSDGRPQGQARALVSSLLVSSSPLANNRLFSPASQRRGASDSSPSLSSPHTLNQRSAQAASNQQQGGRRHTEANREANRGEAQQQLSSLLVAAARGRRGTVASL